MSNFVIVKINDRYRASIYELEDLKYYLKYNAGKVDLNLMKVEDRRIIEIEADSIYKILKVEVSNFVNDYIQKNLVVKDVIIRLNKVNTATLASNAIQIPIKERKVISKPKNNAEDILSNCFLFPSIKEMKELIMEKKTQNLREAKEGRGDSKCIITGHEGCDLLICDDNGRIDKLSEPTYCNSIIPTMKELLVAIQRVIDEYGEENIPHFELVTQNYLQFWESNADKMDGVEPEPFDEGCCIPLLRN